MYHPRHNVYHVCCTMSKTGRPTAKHANTGKQEPRKRYRESILHPSNVNKPCVHTCSRFQRRKLRKKVCVCTLVELRVCGCLWLFVVVCGCLWFFALNQYSLCIVHGERVHEGKETHHTPFHGICSTPLLYTRLVFLIYFSVALLFLYRM